MGAAAIHGHQSQRDFNNTVTIVHPGGGGGGSRGGGGGTSFAPQPDLIFAAHKFTEYYKNECNAGRKTVVGGLKGRRLINTWQ